MLSHIDFGLNDASRNRQRADSVKQEADDDKPAASDAAASTVEEERRERGRVKFGIYKQYLAAVGMPLSIGIFVAMTLMQASKNMTDVWLAEWVTAEKADNKTDPDVVKFYLTVYGGIAGANSLFALLRAFLFAYGGVCAAKSIHNILINVVIRGKSGFFDSTPVGRILNRFSSDLYTVDDSLPFILNIFLARYGVMV